MKYLVCVLILLITSPVFAKDSSSAFMGAHAVDEPAAVEESPVVVKESPVAEQEPEFKIDERLYAESIGSNNGYYGGGYYGEEKSAAQIGYYTITSHRRDFGFGTGFVVVNDQLLPFNLSSSFFAPFPIFSSGILSGGVSFGIGGFGFGIGGFGHGHFGHSHR